MPKVAQMAIYRKCGEEFPKLPELDLSEFEKRPCYTENELDDFLRESQ